MPQKSVKELLIDELKDIYDAEQRLTKALPKLAKAASSEELSAALEDHLKETQGHVVRLEEVFRTLGETPRRKTCKAMVGLLEEGKEIMEEEDALDNIKDLGLIAAAQKVEHYEIATYGCLRAWAEMLKEPKAVKLLQKTLDEETAADEKLTEISKGIEPEAMDDEDEEMMATSGSGRKHGSSMSSR
ncbi:MAG TPA: ferritin-like domain-containing protein [Vicinamibacteria bacterium]